MKRAILMNIGNSHTEITLLDDQCIEPKEILQTGLFLKDLSVSRILQNHPNFPCVSACVVPSVQEKLTKVTNIFDTIHWVNANMELGIDFSLVEKSSIGADRLANAVAALHEFSLPVIILDCGTAITTEVIDAQKRFLGGSITPGRHLGRWALAHGTGQLPLAEICPEIPEPIGRDTSGAIQSGIDLGLLGAMEKILNAVRRMINCPDLKAIVIGGDRHFFVRNLDKVRLGPDNFTLRGLARIAENL